MKRPFRYRTLQWLAMGVSLAGATGADKPASLKEQCAAAYEQTQVLRAAARLKEARERALFCSQDACPAASRKDCTVWLSEIEQSLPTVVLLARDRAGKETAAAQVSLDGAPLLERLEGKAIAVNPGQHTFRFTIEGEPPKEVQAVISQGERNHRVEVSFQPPSPPPAPSPAPAPSSAPRSDAPVAALVVGGLGVAGMGVFAAFGAIGASEFGDLEKSCSPRCTDAQVGSVRTKLLVADIGLVTGLVSLGVATVLFLTSRGSNAPPAKAPVALPALDSFDARPLLGGGFLTVSRSF
jgi:hypothetical protein